jgi:hypothetical protein
MDLQDKARRTRIPSQQPGFIARVGLGEAELLRKSLILTWVVLISISLGACQPDPRDQVQAAELEPAAAVNPANPTPTEVPLDTPTVSPLTAATPAIVVESSPWQPTPTLEVPAVNLPPAALSISQPGPGSYLHSPIKVVGWGGPSYNERVHIRLLGEDGRELAHYVTYLLVYPGKAGRFIAYIYFEIEALAEAARLEVSTESPRNKATHQLSSVEVTLLSRGSPLVRRALNGPEKITILSPAKNSVIESGEIQVLGAAWLESDAPLTVQLIDMRDNILDSQQIWLNTEPGQLEIFETNLRYEVTNSQYARVVVFEPGSDIPGIVHLSSVEVWLVR